MSKRGRKPPRHEPLLCTGCGDPPRIAHGTIQPCPCGASWNLDLLDADRRPLWLDKLTLWRSSHKSG
jgi:hypothetical protein